MIAAATKVTVHLAGEKVMQGTLALPYDGEGPVALLVAGKKRIVPARVIEFVEER